MAQNFYWHVKSHAEEESGDIKCRLGDILKMKLYFP